MRSRSGDGAHSRSSWTLSESDMEGAIGRQFWSREEKQAIVAESLEAGMSIAGVARRHTDPGAPFA